MLMKGGGGEHSTVDSIRFSPSGPGFDSRRSRFLSKKFDVAGIFIDSALLRESGQCKVHQTQLLLVSGAGTTTKKVTAFPYLAVRLRSKL